MARALRGLCRRPGQPASRPATNSRLHSSCCCCCCVSRSSRPPASWKAFHEISKSRSRWSQQRCTARVRHNSCISRMGFIARRDFARNYCCCAAAPSRGKRVKGRGLGRLGLGRAASGCQGLAPSIPTRLVIIYVSIQMPPAARPVYCL